MLIFFVVLMAYIAFDLIDKTRKYEVYEKALNTEIKGLNEKIENLHNDMGLLLQSKRELLADMEKIKEEAEERKKIVINMASTVAQYENNLKDLMHRGKTVKEENENLRKELDSLQLEQEIAKIKIDAFSDYSKTNDDALKDLHNDMDLVLQSHQEQENNMNDLMRQGNAVKEENEKLRKEVDRLQLQLEISEDINDDTLKEIVNGFLFFKRELKDTIQEIQHLVHHVTKMDDEISKLGKNFETLSDKLESLQNGRYGWC